MCYIVRAHLTPALKSSHRATSVELFACLASILRGKNRFLNFLLMIALFNLICFLLYSEVVLVDLVSLDCKTISFGAR